jgi:hypothetical protein
LVNLTSSAVALASSAMLVLSASPAQARMSESQALAAQMRALKTAALWYPAGANYFHKRSQALAGQSQIRHFTNHRSLPSNMRGQDQLSTPGWSGELPF